MTAAPARRWAALRPYLKGLTLIMTFAGCAVLLRLSGLDHALDKGWIDAEVRGRGMAGELLFVGMGALFTALGVPRQFVCFLGGYAFGFVMGTWLSLLASMAGCVGSFLYARLLGRELVASRFAGRVRKMDAFLGRNPVSMTLLIRFLPVGSNLVTNLAAGVSSVGLVPFLIGSALGYIPQTAVFTLLGSGINVSPVLNITMSIALFVASAALGVVLYRKVRKGHTQGELPEDIVDEYIEE